MLLYVRDYDYDLSTTIVATIPDKPRQMRQTLLQRPFMNKCHEIYRCWILDVNQHLAWSDYPPLTRWILVYRSTTFFLIYFPSRFSTQPDTRLVICFRRVLRPCNTLTDESLYCQLTRNITLTGHRSALPVTFLLSARSN